MLKDKWAVFDWEVFPEWNCKAWAEYDDNGGYSFMKVITPDTIEDAIVINKILDEMGCHGKIDLDSQEIDGRLRAQMQHRYIRNTYNVTGYNVIGYDLMIDDGACQGYTPGDLYRLNNQIIEEQYRSFGYWRKYIFTDLMSDLKKVGSLKVYESNKGIDIRETTVPFGKRNLTLQERAEIIFYCCHDVYASCMMLKDRWGYIQNKINVSKLSHLNAVECLKNTSAKLASKVTQCKKKPSTSQPIYEIPERLAPMIKQHIHPAIIDAFDQADIADNDWSYSCKYLLNEIVFGVGGIHSTYGSGSLLGHSTDNWVLLNIDYENQYPGIMVEYDLYPEGMPEQGRALLRSMLDSCRSLKAELRTLDRSTEEYVDKYAVRDSLKLVLNALTGAMRSKWSDLFDPMQIIKLCMTGQLVTILIAKHMHNLGAKIIQMNTDGILIYIRREILAEATEVISELEKLVGIPLELEQEQALFQKDVNNYIAQDVKGRLKRKGRWAKQSGGDMPLEPLFAPIINDALVEKYINNTPIEDTIRNCTNALDFCMTTNRIRGREDTIHDRTDSDHYDVVNKVNRVYASTNKSLGTLRCVNYDGPEISTSAKIASIPDNCNLYNEHVTVHKPDLDYQWYIDKAYDRLKEMEDITED